MVVLLVPLRVCRAAVVARKEKKAQKWADIRFARERLRFLHLGFNVFQVIRQRAINVRKAAMVRV